MNSTLQNLAYVCVFLVVLGVFVGLLGASRGDVVGQRVLASGFGLAALATVAAASFAVVSILG